MAAGLGVRMGSPKAFLPLDGKPMLYYSLQAFQRSSVDGIGIVTRKEDLELAQNLARTYAIGKVSFVVPGGKERQDSVLEGIHALPKRAELAAVHDAARPLVTVELIDAVIEIAREKGAALAAIPMRDTVKSVRDHCVRETLNREQLWSAQTPQAFRLDLFRKAVEKAHEDNFYGTDCSSLLERIGVTVHLVDGSTENLKVTTPSDVLMADALVRRMHV